MDPNWIDLRQWLNAWSRWTTAFVVWSIASTATAQIDFARDVRPLFERYCYECHGPKKQKSGYRLDVRELALKGGDFGEVAIVPNDSLNSPIFRYASGEEEDLLMPPKKSGKGQLTNEELFTLKTWIDEGASWPDEFAGKARHASSHWSLQPLRLLEAVVDDRANIDQFIREKLNEQQLSPSPQADRRTLIRRLSFDLVGLPPSIEEIEAFLADESPNAYELLVERLLSSPHYGERWGRHWLDVARYTESQGFEYDRIRENAWHYRDYVIKSFNDDKPYTQFMREQIAGDVMEPITTDGIVATSLLVCGPWDQAGNSQANLIQKAITREDELEDLIGVVGQSFLGLTINCARCHAHKFDPIPHEDYYRIKSVFEGVKHGEREISSNEEAKSRIKMREALDSQIDLASKTVREIETEGIRQFFIQSNEKPETTVPLPLNRWVFSEPNSEFAQGELNGGASIKKSPTSSVVLNLPAAGAFFKTTALTHTIREKTLEVFVSLASLDQGGGAAITIETDNGSIFDAIVFGEREPKKWMAGSNGFSRTRDLDSPEESSAPDTFIHLAIVYSSDNSIAMYRNGEPWGKPYIPSTPLQTFPAGSSRILLGLRHTGGSRPWLTGEIKQAALYDRALTRDEVAASFRAQGNAPTKAEILSSLTAELAEAHAKASAEMQRDQQALLDLQKPPKSYVGVRVQPPITKRLKRGEVSSPAEEVTPGGLSAVFELDANFGLSADAPEKDRRLKFADWLADDRNPLPVRVMVNRVWHLHFGQGLVATPNDLGVSGDPPSHRELLDWLAAKFIQSGWSVKSLHRLIVNSSTYQQSSAFNAKAASIDGDNRFLWRFTPRRLEAEAVRDAMLFASGELNPIVGGPSFRPFTTTDFNATFYTPSDRWEPEFNRRTVYRMNVNSGKDPLLDSFDCPDPSVKTPRRGITMTPLQALELMNNSFVQRQSGHLAKRALQSSNNDVLEAIKIVYQLALGRFPIQDEIERASIAVEERGLFSLCWALFNSTEFIYVK